MIAQLITPTHLAIPPRRRAPPLRTQTPTSDRPGARARPARIHRSSNRTRGADGRASLPGSLRWRTQAGAHDWIRMTRRDDRRLSLLCAVMRSCGSRTTSGEVWLCRAAVEDTYSRLIAGWPMATHMRPSLVVDAPKRALARRRPDPRADPPFRPRRAVRQSAVRPRRTRGGIAVSTGSRGDAYDNAVAQTFFATLKKELVSGRSWMSRLELHSAVFEYVDAFYNRQRPHSGLEMLSPVATNNYDSRSAIERNGSTNNHQHHHHPQLSRKPRQVRRSALASAQMRRRKCRRLT